MCASSVYVSLPILFLPRVLSTVSHSPLLPLSLLSRRNISDITALLGEEGGGTPREGVVSRAAISVGIIPASGVWAVQYG